MLHTFKMLLAIPLLLGAGLITVIPAHATVTVYTDRAAFLAAIAGVSTNIDFEMSGADEIDFGTAAGLTVSGVNFVGEYNGSDGNLIMNYLYAGNASADWGWFYAWGSGRVLYGYGQNGSSQWGRIDATLPAGIKAVGSDVMLYPWGGAPIDSTSYQRMDYKLAGGSSYQQQPGLPVPVQPGHGFIGVISDDEDITSLRFTQNFNGYSYGVILDNFVYQGPVGTLTGSLSLGSYVGDLSLAPVKVEFVPTIDGAPYTKILALAAAAETYTIPGVAAGTYDVYFSACKWVKIKVSGVVITQGTTTDAPNVNLVNGDLNGDNHVTTTDLSVLLSNIE